MPAMAAPAYEPVETPPSAEASEVEPRATRGCRGTRAAHAVAVGVVLVLASLAVAVARAQQPRLRAGATRLEVLAEWPSNLSRRAAVLTSRRPPSNLTTTRTTTTTVSPAPLYEFYMYRASTAEGKKYEFGNINMANLDGVVWYLVNEVVTKYGQGPRCPRKFNISQINRYKIRMRATRELFETGINFGVRFSYDFGMCMGRCFAGNQCSGQDDCDVHYDRFGFNVGCNKFADRYPFPDDQTAAPEGIWYALPLDGRCKGEPTGARDCTWSYDDAGSVDLADVEATNPWGPNCCPAERCTGLWERPFDVGATSWRAQAIRGAFTEKFPHMPTDLGPSQCDFYKDAWYSYDADTWPLKDPWADDKGVSEAYTTDGEHKTNKTNKTQWKDDSYNRRL